ncbi:MAG: RagB/SusD family nutrient uptake outer membrane protein [Bacteroidetes bacterium]|nr:RagB/SusD family nutrient uptake outer membrane protein [Bacteroidota bacterium]
MKYVSFILFLIIAAAMVSCEDFLEPELEGKGTYDEEFVWDNPSFARGPLYYAYGGIPTTFRTVEYNYTDIATDNAVSNNVSGNMRNFGMGLLSASNNTMDKWNEYYRYIRSLNLFMENGLSPIGDDDEEHDVMYYTDSTENAKAFIQYRGEAYFLRAWYHWSLLKLYGAEVGGESLGIPVVKTILSEEEAFELSRSTYVETVLAIAADCDSAVIYLQNDYSGNDIVTGETHYGAPTTHAARSLKAMAYVFAASPAYTDGTITMDSAAFHLAVALEEYDGSLNGNSLQPRDFLNTSNRDAIWRSHFSSNYFGNELQNYPPSYRGDGETNPSRDLVKCFPLSDGYPYEMHSQEVLDLLETYSPYQFSDPRLKSSIIYDGTVLNGHVDLGLENYTVDTYVGGEESREAFPITGTKTGYYLNKFYNGNNTELYPSRKNGSLVFYTAISQTNLYLFFAEALNEIMADPTTVSDYGVSAKDILGKIRGRVGFKSLVDPGDTKDYYLDEVAAQGQEAFRDFIRNERRIELCFEDTRFWDLRRWGLEVNTPVHGIRITLDEDSPNGKHYEEFEVEVRAFASESLPIPYSEINLMPNLVQNEGWE